MGSIKPKNLMFVDDASIEGDSTAMSHNQNPHNNVYLTRSISPMRDETLEETDSLEEEQPQNKKKVTLNLKLPKNKLKALKHIAAIIQTRDPNTNALITKQKKFKVEYLAKNVQKKLRGRRAINRAIFMSTIYKSVNQSSVLKDDKSTRNPASVSINQRGTIVQGISLGKDNSQRDGEEGNQFLKDSNKHIILTLLRS